MHELGIAKDIFKQMQAAAENHGLKKVGRVVFKIGVLNGIEEGHLVEHLEEYAAGTALEGAQYEFIQVSPGDELEPSEAAGRPEGGSGKPTATGFEIIIASMEGR